MKYYAFGALYGHVHDFLDDSHILFKLHFAF